MLDAIVEASIRIEKYLRKAGGPQLIQPRSRWKAAVTTLALRSRKRPSSRFQELHKLAGALSRSVDELWIYLETVFDSLHGVLAHETRLPERERLPSSALQLRTGSHDLYKLCLKSTMDCSLGMDLLDIGTTRSSFLNDSGDHSLRLLYQLFT